MPDLALTIDKLNGFMNLARVEAPVGFTLDAIPAPPPIFARARGRQSRE